MSELSGINNEQMACVNKLSDLTYKMQELLFELPEEYRKLMALRMFTLLIEGIDLEFSRYMSQILDGGIN